MGLTMTALVGFLIIGTLIGILRFTSPAVRQLSYRKGSLWYLGPSTAKESSPPAYQRPTRTMGIPRGSIRAWALTAGAFVAFAVILWAPLNYPAPGVISAVLGVGFAGMAFEGWRQNHWLAGNAGLVAEHLLTTADLARQESDRLAERGEYGRARIVLADAAKHLRELAPGSGSAHEILARAVDLEDRAGRVPRPG
jgi:hypothetical protein